MIIVTSLGGVIALMLVGMLLLGTWPAVWNHVERSGGKIPAHTFMDYSLTYTAVGIITSLTLGQFGPPYNGRPNFLQQLSVVATDGTAPLVGFAATGGACLAMGDIAMQYSVAFLGLAVGPPILNALTIIIGVLLSWYLDGGLNRPSLVFPGMAASAMAIALGAEVLESKDRVELGHPPVKRQRSVLRADKSVYTGLIIAVVGGAVYSLFLPAFQVAANDSFGLLPQGAIPLSIYATNFFFSLSFGALSVALNCIFLYRPPLGTARSSLGAWLRDHHGRGWAVLSGLLAALGDGTQFMGGQVAGYAAAMLVMAYPLVGILWGMLRWGEYGGSGAAGRRGRALVAAQAAAYAASVALLACSAEMRPAGGGDAAVATSHAHH